MISNHEYIYYGDRLLIVKRKIHEGKLKQDFDAGLLKEWTRSDILLRKEGFIYCCETLQEPEIISESSEN